MNQNKECLINDLQNSYSTNSQKELVGGRNQEWKTIIESICQKYIKQRTPQTEVEEMGELANVKKKKNVEQIKNPYILNPDDYETQDELFEAIRHWWIFKKRKHKNTVKKRLPSARRMSKHPVFPINWKDINQNQIIAYLEYREYKENAGKHAIRNE